MRVIGLCTTCNKFRYVRVTSNGLVSLQTSGVVEGVCAECEEKEDDRRR